MPSYPQEADSKCEADAFIGLQHIHHVQRLQTIIDPLIGLLPEFPLVKQCLQGRHPQTLAKASEASKGTLCLHPLTLIDS